MTSSAPECKSIKCTFPRSARVMAMAASRTCSSNERISTVCASRWLRTCNAHIFKLALRLLLSLTHGLLRPLAFFHLGFHFPLPGDGQSGAGVGVTLGTPHGLANGDDDEAADEIQTQPSEVPRAEVQRVAELDEQPLRGQGTGQAPEA